MEQQQDDHMTAAIDNSLRDNLETIEQDEHQQMDETCNHEDITPDLENDSSVNELKEFYQTFAEEMKEKIENITTNADNQKSDNTTCDYEYSLSAVVSHKGYKSTETGHYVADIFWY